MSLTKAFGTDSKKEREGVWVVLFTNDDNTIARMRILRTGSANLKFTARYAALSKAIRTLPGNKQTLTTNALREAFVETCLLEWENIENINEATPGTTREPYMPLTKENAINLFKLLPDLFEHVIGQASDLENFQSEAVTETAKNSFPS